MSAILAATIFSASAIFSLVVIIQMLRAYRDTMLDALNRRPLPRSQSAAYVTRARRMPAAFTPRRMIPARAAA